MRKIGVVVSLLLASLAGAAPPQKALTVSVMTQNMDAGTDLGYALYGLTQADPRPYIDLTLAEVTASGISERAALLAGEIALRKPHLVALEEVTLWRVGDTPATTTTVLYDQLDALMTALKDSGASYEVVAVNTLTDIALPTTGTAPLPGAVRFTDRDVLLARADLAESDFHLSDVHARVYKAAVTFGDISVRRGYITALARVGNKLFRIAATHLENKYADVLGSEAIQQMQTEELLAFMRNSPQPVILAGDFNADAIAGVDGLGPDNTATVDFVTGLDYTDSWAAVNSTSSGATWPLFLEDQQATFFAPSTPWERIDLIFSRGVEVVSSELVFSGLVFGTAASDHAGVISTFRLGK